MKKKIAVLFMASGLILIASALVLLLYNNFENRRAQESSSAVLGSVIEIIENNMTENQPDDPFDEEMLIKEIDGHGYIGYVSIPVLEINLPVMSDWSYSKLKIAPCRYYGSTKTDNLVIAAHNYKYHFGSLGHLKENDIVTFTDMESRVYTYKVTSVEQLMPTDTDAVKDSGDELILYTCTYGGAKRITVRCSLVSES